MMVAAHCWWLGLCCLWLADEALCAPPPAHTHLKNGGNGSSSIVVRFGPGAAYYETFLRLVMPVVLRPLTLATHRDVVLVDETEAAAEGHCSVGGGIESVAVASWRGHACAGKAHRHSWGEHDVDAHNERSIAVAKLQCAYSCVKGGDA